MPSVSRYRRWIPVPADERAHARHLGQGAQTLVRPPGGGPVQAGPLAAPATGRLHERQ